MACTVRSSVRATSGPGGRRGSAASAPHDGWRSEAASTSRASSASSRASQGSSAAAGSRRRRRATRAPRARQRRQWSTSLCRAIPTSQPVLDAGGGTRRHGRDRGQERLGGEVLGDGRAGRTGRAGTRTPGAARRRRGRAARGQGRAAPLVRRSHPFIGRRPRVPTVVHPIGPVSGRARRPGAPCAARR